VPITAKSLPRLVAGLTTGVLSARTEAVSADVIFVDREPVDGMALRDGRRVTGPDALDEIADVAVSQLSFRALPRDLASVAGSYFLPTEVREVPAVRVLPEAFVRSLARPDGRGCVLVRAGAETGLIFLARGQVALALHVDAARVGGLEAVSELLADPEARFWARLGELGPAVSAVPSAGGAVQAAGGAVQAAPPGPDLEAASAVAAPGPAPSVPVMPPAPAVRGDEALERILEIVRLRLGRNSTSVEEVFRAAPHTDAGLRSAAESVRTLRIRLVSPATLEEIADGAIAVLGGER
jgi:hypothetical protein